MRWLFYRGGLKRMKPFGIDYGRPQRLLSRLAQPVLCVLAVFALPAGWGQVAQPQPPRPPFQQPVGSGVGGGNDTQQGSEQDERLLRAMNADRQKSMVADANKLLKLAKELNAEIARTNPDALTAEQLHKMAEIEKLARNVREKMSISVRGPPAFLSPMQPLQ